LTFLNNRGAKQRRNWGKTEEKKRGFDGEFWELQNGPSTQASSTQNCKRKWEELPAGGREDKSLVTRMGPITIRPENGLFWEGQRKRRSDARGSKQKSGRSARSNKRHEKIKRPNSEHWSTMKNILASMVGGKAEKLRPRRDEKLATGLCGRSFHESAMERLR